MFDFAIDCLLARPVVNGSRFMVHGLSMEVTVMALCSGCRSHRAQRGGP
jgi:hypothetical protein